MVDALSRCVNVCFCDILAVGYGGAWTDSTDYSVEGLTCEIDLVFGRAVPQKSDR